MPAPDTAPEGVRLTVTHDEDVIRAALALLALLQRPPPNDDTKPVRSDDNT